MKIFIMEKYGGKVWCTNEAHGEQETRKRGKSVYLEEAGDNSRRMEKGRRFRESKWRNIHQINLLL